MIKATTRSGLPVRILCTDRACQEYPVVGLIMLPSGVELTTCWTLEGKRHVGHVSYDDLIDFSVPEAAPGLPAPPEISLRDHPEHSMVWLDTEVRWIQQYADKHARTVLAERLGGAWPC